MAKSVEIVSLPLSSNEVLRNAYEWALETLGHDALKGHREEDAHKGKSWFVVKDPLGFFKPTDQRVVVDSPDLKIVTCGTPLPVVGYEVTARPIPGKRYTMKTIHGCLQLVGPPKIKETPTMELSVVLTREEGGWALASIFPGKADPPLNQEGLSEGAEVDGEELLRRNYFHVIPE